MNVQANSNLPFKFEETTALSNGSIQIDLNPPIYAEKPIICRLCLSADPNYSNFCTLFDAIDYETNIVDVVAKHFTFIQVFEYIFIMSSSLWCAKINYLSIYI